MERLWTPWRAEFVTGQASSQGKEGTQPDCFLCENPALRTDDATYILHRAIHAYIILNLYPYNTGHLLIAPYAHGANFGSLPVEAGTEMWNLAQRGVRILTAEYGADGFNIGMNLGHSAGAGVPGHLHLHVVPRWNGDTNFLPVLGNTKVLPESLEQTYRRLKHHFDSESGRV